MCVCPFQSFLEGVPEVSGLKVGAKEGGLEIKLKRTPTRTFKENLFGGKGTIFGTFIGVLIIGSLESGIVALGLSGFYVQFINGIMITSAVTIYAIIQRKKT